MRFTVEEGRVTILRGERNSKFKHLHEKFSQLKPRQNQKPEHISVELPEGKDIKKFATSIKQSLYHKFGKDTNRVYIDKEQKRIKIEKL